jgi:glycosyltransferase involved in cell wall biosynthesis
VRDGEEGPMIRVAYEVPDETGCYFYRVKSPLETASRLSGGTLRALPLDRYVDENHLAVRVDGANVYTAARVVDGAHLDLIAKIHEKGKKFVVDYDDDVFNVDPFSSHYRTWGTKPAQAELKGEKIEIWEDGKNIFFEENQKRLDNVKRLCGAADMVTVTTERLAESFRPYSQNVKVLPNCVDIGVWNKAPILKTSEIRMGWFGGSSHYVDWLEVVPVLPDLFDRYENLKLVIMGQKFPWVEKNVPKDRYEYHRLSHIQAYPYKSSLLNLDFAVIPLASNKFNEGKSVIKWVEMGALSVPSVTSFVPPYDSIADLVPENGIFVENAPDAWIAGISRMIEDPLLRSRMGKAARKTVEENFDMEKRYPLWVDAYKGVLDGITIPANH